MVKMLQGLMMVVVFAGAALAWRLIYAHYAMQSIQNAITTMNQQQQADFHRSMQKIQADAARRRVDQLAEAEIHRQQTQLLPNQRCIGGTVVEVNGTSYTQIAGLAGRPLACAGRTRL